MSLEVTVGIPTKDRYETLAICLTAIAMQTLKPKQVIIVDDSDNKIDLREVPNFQYIFQLFNYYKIEFEVIFGQQKGQHFSHQMIQEKARYDWIFRCDDDNICEPTCLERMAEVVTDKVGAVGPLILMPNPGPLIREASNDIENLYAPNIQWFTWTGVKSVDHLNSCFLYRKGVAKFNLTLSRVAHREETIFTYEIKRAGYEILVNGDSRMWHFRQASGGIRSKPGPEPYEHDENVFRKLLKQWNVGVDTKLVVLDNGMGDHFAFKNILAELKTRHKKIIIAACFNDVFWDEPTISLTSIAAVMQAGVNLEEYDIYRKMIDWRWTGTLVEAFKKLYL